MDAKTIVELAGLKSVQPYNPLANELIDKHLENDEEPGQAFACLMQLAWSIGETTQQERQFAKAMHLDLKKYIRIRNRTRPYPGASKFQTLAGFVFDENPHRIEVEA